MGGAGGGGGGGGGGFQAPAAIVQLTEDDCPRPSAVDYSVNGTVPASAIGNCDPRYMRLSVRAMPNSSSLRVKSGLPFGMVVRPFGDDPADPDCVPLVNTTSTGVIRCRRCRTYINPFVTWADQGRRWRCNVCGLLNDVPPNYFCNLDANNQRKDRAERPELSRGSVEFVAPQEYMVRPPQPAVYVFMLFPPAQPSAISE
jgi:protein transport protein SEC24